MNIENLTKLADYLDGVEPEKFDMRNFKSECGTVACAAGYLPEATGIEKPYGDLWLRYVQRVTDLGEFYGGYHWCFAAAWLFCDNTPQGAAKRIRYMLKNGLPKDWDFDEETVELYQ